MKDGGTEIYLKENTFDRFLMTYFINFRFVRFAHPVGTSERT